MLRTTGAMLAALLCGCSNNHSTQQDTMAETVEVPMASSLDPGRPKLDEAAILKIAEQAVRENDTWADRAEYSAERDENGWQVLVSRLPKVPGGQRYIRIDDSGMVTNYGRGL
jgi:hypothetical protein